MSVDESTLKHLARCAGCGRQYDIAGLEPESRFHCSCGEVLTVSAVAPKDSAVVRCSACGGARRGQEASCSFCEADFTVHERDLVAICPGCATRLPRTAKFCHGCGVAIDLQASRPGGPSDRECPACGDGTLLRSRRLGEVGAAGEDGREQRRLGAVLECPHCAGLWIAAEAFSQLERRAKSGAVLDTKLSDEPSSPSPPTLPTGPGGPLYRKCVTCGELMHRRNYARRSGVVVDVCRDHGIWFDEKELEAILHWVRSGGWAREEERREREQTEAKRRERSRAQTGSVLTQPVSPYGYGGAGWIGGMWLFGAIAEALDGLFDLR